MTTGHEKEQRSRNRFETSNPYEPKTPNPYDRDTGRRAA